MSEENNERPFIRLVWRSFPFGWAIRHLSEDGHYLAEVLMESPPFREVVSGQLSSADNGRIQSLARQVIDALKDEPGGDHEGAEIGFLAICVGPGQVTGNHVYRYYAAPDRRASTRSYLRILLVLDPYLRPAFARAVESDPRW